MLKILLFKRGAIGDMLMATPLLRQLKQKVNCQLELVVGQAASSAVKNNPYLDHIHILPDLDFALSGSLRLIKWWLRHRQRYDYVFILDKHSYFNGLARLSGARLVGYSRQSWLSRLSLHHYVNYHDVTRYHAYYYLDLLASSNLVVPDYNDIHLDLTVSSEDRQVIDDFLHKHQLTRFVVIVNSGGNNAYEQNGVRMLPQSLVCELIAALLARGLSVVLLGSQLDVVQNQDYCNSLASEFSGLNAANRLINAAGQFNLAASCYLLSQALHFYTTDCGAMHLGVAANLGARMTAVFGPTHPAHILPTTYLSQSALWLDQHLFSADYQLTGTPPPATKQFFQQITCQQLLEQLKL